MRFCIIGFGSVRAKYEFINFEESVNFGVFFLEGGGTHMRFLDIEE